MLLDLANKGIPEAQINLGMMFERGQGVPQDYNEAIRWYRLATDLGHIKAQEKLNSLLKKSADAQINFGLGVIFENGQGVPQDYNEAIRWYRLAADLGHIKAQEKLNLLLNKTKEHLQENTASSKEFKSLKEKNSKEIKDLQTTTASLRSELNQIKSEKAKAIEAANQANAKVKQEQLASSKEFKSLKEKSSKEIKDLQATTASLRSELNQIKSEKAKAIEAINQANAKAKQEQLASTSGNPSELNTGSDYFWGDTFDGGRYSENTFTGAGDDINVKFDSFRLRCSQLKNKDQQSECFEKFSEAIVKDKIKKHSIFKKNSTPNLTKKSQPSKSRNNSEVITPKDLVSKHLDKWARAWEKQDIELYLSFYSKEFKGSKERHKDWRISRQAALKKHTSISIQLQNIQISQSKDTVEINFTQTFKSDGYLDIGVKELVWAKNGSAWRIIKETWIPHKKTT